MSWAQPSLTHLRKRCQSGKSAVIETTRAPELFSWSRVRQCRFVFELRVFVALCYAIIYRDCDFTLSVNKPWWHVTLLICNNCFRWTVGTTIGNAPSGAPFSQLHTSATDQTTFTHWLLKTSHSKTQVSSLHSMCRGVVCTKSSSKWRCKGPPRIHCTNQHSAAVRQTAS